MFGATLRGAATFVVGMLFASILNAVLSPLLDILINVLGENSMLVGSLQEVNENFVLVVLFAALLAFIARAVVESSLPGGA